MFHSKNPVFVDRGLTNPIRCKNWYAQDMRHGSKLKEMTTSGL